MAAIPDISSRPHSILKPDSKYRRILIVIICLHFALLLAMGLFHHWGYLSNIHDLGVFDQAVWGTLHGHWFLHTINTFGQQINWLGFHFNPFLLLFVPLYAIWPAAEWFALAQALALSVAAWPIFLLASRVHGSERTGVLWAAVYLLNPFLLSAAAWDFHPVTLAVPIIAIALLAVEKKDFRLLMICCLCMLLIQEQFGITVIGFGALWGFHHSEWKRSLLLITLGAISSVLILGILMPALSPSGTHALIDPGSQFSRYGWLGGSFFEIFSNIILHPLTMFTKIVSMYGTISYLTLLTLPFLGLFFAAPVWLLPTIADLAANLLAAVSMPRSIISYHSVTLIPILTVAAIYGARRIAPLLLNRITIPLTNIVLLLTIGLSYTFAPLPLPGSLNFWQPVKWVQFPDPVLKQIRELISASASLSVQANIGAHFTQQLKTYRYPHKNDETETIVLWLDSPTKINSPYYNEDIGTLAHHLQMNPTVYLASIECLLRDPGYKVMMWQDPWLVINRGAGDMHINLSVQMRIEALRTEWGITPH